MCECACEGEIAIDVNEVTVIHRMPNYSNCIKLSRTVACVHTVGAVGLFSLKRPSNN